MYPIRFSKENALITLVAGIIILILGYLGMPCIFLTIFGVPCPGCGMTHAFLALLSFRFRDAFSYNPCIFLLPLFYLYFWQNGVVFRNRLINRLVLLIAGCLFILRYILFIFSY